MRELGLAALFVLMFLAGVLTGFGDRAHYSAIAADNHSLRESNKTLRAQCPARPRIQRGPFVPGSTA